MKDEKGRAWWENGKNVLSLDFNPETDVAHPDRFRELFDEDPRKSVIQPGGVMWTYVVDGRPGVRDE